MDLLGIGFPGKKFQQQPQVACKPDGRIAVLDISIFAGCRGPGVGNEGAVIPEEMPQFRGYQHGILECHLVAMYVDVDMLLPCTGQPVVNGFGELPGGILRALFLIDDFRIQPERDGAFNRPPLLDVDDLDGKTVGA